MSKPAATAPAATEAAPTPQSGKSTVAAQMGYLLSRLDYPVTIDYGNTKLRVSPGGRTGTLNRALLKKTLPSGVTFVNSTL